MNDRVFVMRQAIIKLTQLLAGRGIEVTQQGISAYVRSDPSGRPLQVNLPYMPDNAPEELINAIQGFLDHEVAHVLYTDFTVMPSAGRAASMFNILEDTRIERCMGERFTGSGYNLSVTQKFFLDKYTKPKMNEAIASSDDNMLVGVLMVPLLRAMAGQQVFEEFMKDHMGYIKPVYDKIKHLAPRVAALSSSHEALDLAREIMDVLHGKEEEEKAGKGRVKGKATSTATTKGKTGSGKPTGAGKDEGEGEGEGEDEDESKGEGEDEDKKEDEEGVEEEEEGEESTASGDDDDDDLSKSAGEDPLPNSLLDAIDKETANDFDSSVSNELSAHAATAAKHSDYLVFTTDKDVIEPLRVGSGYVDRMLVELQDQVDHLVGPLQKDLERAISARSLAVYSSGHRSGRIHAANLARLTIARPNGDFDDRVFRRKHETNSKDVAVELVIDCSGSMSGSRIHTATQAAYALASTLDRIDIRNEVIGFTTGELVADMTLLRDEEHKIGRHFNRAESLYMPILKGFEERMTTDVKKRFGWLPNSSIMASNVDGECVMVAARRLLQRREQGKVMIVLSDGNPAAHGPVGDLQTHLRKVVQDITKTGVSVVGIGIETDVVQRYYPKFMVLQNVKDLPAAVMKELRALIIK